MINLTNADLSPGINPPLPILGNRCFPSLVVVPVGVLRDQRAKGNVFLDRLECRGISRAISNRDPSRIRPLASLSPSRRTGKPNRALATRRRCLCESATTPRRHTLEHRCSAAGERSARPNHHAHGEREPLMGLVCGSPRPTDIASRQFLYTC